MKRLIAILQFSLLSFVVPHLHGQTNIDSLKISYYQSENDRDRAEILNKLSWEYLHRSPDSAMQFARLAIHLAQKSNYKHGIAQGNIRLGYYWQHKAVPDKAEVYFDKARSIYLSTGDSVGAAAATASLGVIQLDRGAYAKALKTLLEAERIFRSNRKMDDVANTLIHIGTVFYYQEKYDTTLSYWNQALNIYTKTENISGISYAAGNVGIIHDIQGEYHDALRYYNQSLKIQQELGDLAGVARNLDNIGHVQKNLKQYAEAKTTFQNALIIHRQTENHNGKAHVFTNMGDLASQLEQYHLARQHYDSAAFSAAKAKNPALLIASKKQLADAEQKLGNSTRAFHLLSEATSLEDSIFTKEKQKELDELMVKYESEKKQRKISELDLQNQLSETALEKKSLTIWGLGITVGLIILIAGALIFIIWQHQITKQKIAEHNKLLVEQRLVESEKNRKIEAMQSILKGQEDERKRIARELHDSVGSMLSTAKLQFSILDTNEEENLEKATKLLDDACTEVRRISHNMMPESLLKFGLLAAIKDLAGKLDSSGGIQVDYQVYGEFPGLSAETELEVYRIVQELLNNVMKHSEATELMIQITSIEGSLNIMIEDNGKGFNTETVTERNGLGLKNLQLRTELLSGSINFDSQPGAGTTVMLDIPFTNPV